MILKTNTSLRSAIGFLLINIGLLVNYPMVGYSQVTIGDTSAPNKGAILDLKMGEDGKSTKGLLLPRVGLKDAYTLEPMFDYKIKEPTLTEKQEHIGLTIYNVKRSQQDPCDFSVTKIKEGVYLWNGEYWEALIKEANTTEDILQIVVRDPNVKVFIDERNGEKEPYTCRMFGAAGIWMTTNMRATRYSDGHPHIPYERNMDLKKGGIYNDKTSGISEEERKKPTTGSYYMTPYPYLVPGSTNAPNFGWDDTWIKKNILAGFVYNYSAIIGYEGGKKPTDLQKIQGLCPKGWHVPELKDWKALKDAIFADPQSFLIKDENKPEDPYGYVKTLAKTFMHAFIVPCTPFESIGPWPTTPMMAGYSLSYSDGGFGDYALGTTAISSSQMAYTKNMQHYWYNSGFKKDIDKSNTGNNPKFLKVEFTKEVTDSYYTYSDVMFAQSLRCIKDNNSFDDLILQNP